MIFALLKKNKEIPLGKSWKPDGRILKKILYIGVPNGLENSIFQIGKLMVSSLIAGFGTASITANAIVGNVGNFQLIPGNAIGMAMITVIGQCVGAGDESRRNIITKTDKDGVSLYDCSGVGLIVLARPSAASIS